MEARNLRPCFVLFLVQLLHTSVLGVTTIDALKVREAEQAIISTVCECSVRLIPEVKGIYEILWVLSGIVEKAQMKAAVVSEMSRNNRTSEEEAAIPLARSLHPFNPQFGNNLFIDHMRQDLFPQLDVIRGSITRVGEGGGGGQRSFDIMEDGHCPLRNTIETYKNLSSQVTDAAHFMADVEMDDDLAATNLLSIRIMVVQMNNKTHNFNHLLKSLRNISCPEAAESTLTKEESGRAFGEKSVDCPCIEQILPEARKLIDALSWVLYILKDTQGHALWTISKNTAGRTNQGRAYGNTNDPEMNSVEASETDDDLRRSKFNTTFLGVDFYDSFKKELATPKPLISRSALNPSDEDCPMLELLEYQQKLQMKLTDAVHYREDVKTDADVARNVLPMVTQSIMEMEKKFEEYNDYITDLEAKC